MTSRARRLATGVALLVVALFVGRWTSDLLAERWWAATISPAAVGAVTRWRLLGLALDAFAVVGAACWFALQAVVVARAVASVQPAGQVGSLRLRATVPARLLLFAAIATGVLLGLVTGAGAREWRGPVALAWQGVHYGLRDPYLRTDLGIFVSQLPLWDVAHGFITLLVVLGLCFVGMLYVSIGAIRRENAVLIVHPYARRHLGMLFVALSAVISVGYLLAPYHFITTPTAPMSVAGALTRIRSAQVMAGVALGIAVLSLLWIRRGRHALLVSGWSVLIIAALVERIVVPALTAEASAPAGSDAVLRRFDALAWGIVEDQDSVLPDSVPAVTALWNESLLARYVESGGGILLAATPAVVSVGTQSTPAWLVAQSSAGDSTRLDVLAIQEGITAASGRPVSLRPADLPSTRPVWRAIGDARLTPDGPSWRVVPTGVSIGGALRRIALAWARQGGRLLLQGGGSRVDWHLDPGERAAALLPVASWLPADIAVIGGRPLWVVHGLIRFERFPLATQSTWRGEQAGGVVPGFVATMDPASGVTKFYLDPAADSTAAAWARFFSGLVQPAAAIPAELKVSLPYPAAWLESQLQVLESPEWGLGRRQAQGASNGPPGQPVPSWPASSQPARQSAFEDPGRRALSTLVSAERVHGIPTLRIERYEGSTITVESALELIRLWGKVPPLMHVRDSTRAAGDSVEPGSVHWLLSGHTLTAWQPMFARSARGSPMLLWIATSLGARLGGGRSVGEAWSSVLSAGTTGSRDSRPGDAVIVARARLLMLRADSALARGDLTAFGRAIEELRAVLKR